MDAWFPRCIRVTAYMGSDGMCEEGTRVKGTRKSVTQDLRVLMTGKICGLGSIVTAPQVIHHVLNLYKQSVEAQISLRRWSRLLLPEPTRSGRFEKAGVCRWMLRRQWSRNDAWDAPHAHTVHSSPLPRTVDHASSLRHALRFRRQCRCRASSATSSFDSLPVSGRGEGSVPIKRFRGLGVGVNMNMRCDMRDRACVARAAGCGTRRSDKTISRDGGEGWIAV